MGYLQYQRKFSNNELIEKLLRRYPDSERTLQSLSIYNRETGEYKLSSKLVAKRYSNFQNLK
jgi:hypothetical protein